ncbi:hypothetical protein ACLB2K_042934 [Fragaria x ananassa]
MQAGQDTRQSTSPIQEELRWFSWNDPGRPRRQAIYQQKALDVYFPSDFTVRHFAIPGESYGSLNADRYIPSRYIHGESTSLWRVNKFMASQPVHGESTSFGRKRVRTGVSIKGLNVERSAWGLWRDQRSPRPVESARALARQEESARGWRDKRSP